MWIAALFGVDVSTLPRGDIQIKKGNVMAADRDILNVPIGGEWYASEMAELITTIEEHYSDMVLLHAILDLQNEKEIASPEQNIIINSRLSEIERTLFNEEGVSREFLAQTDWLQNRRLEVHRISYGSKGGWDFAGIGTAVKAVSDFLLGILNYVGSKEKRREKCLENAQKAIELAKMGRASEENIQKMTAKALRRCGFLFDLKEQKKLV